MRWGLFFGEPMVRPGGTGEEPREHVHLGTCAAGRAIAMGDMDWNGTAVYEGHAIGNVFDGSSNSLYTAVGRYTNEWSLDRGNGHGHATMHFDGARYEGQTRRMEDRAGFVGALRSTDGARAGRLDGRFVGPVTDFSGGRSPEGLVGQFAIGNTDPQGSAYCAAGTVAAEPTNR